MDLNEVAVFIRVVQKRSFTAAALALGMPKSTVSMKVTNLERRLGTSLITRSTRKLRITPAGEAFFLRVTKSLDEIFAAEGAARSDNAEPQGKFRLTTPLDLDKYILPELTARFLKKYPKVEIEILATNRRVDFLEDQVDLAIRAGHLKDSTLIARKIGDAEFRMFASPKYLREHGHPAILKDIQDHNCVTVSGVTTGEWKLQGLKRPVTIPVRSKIVLSDILLAHAFAVQGMGIALLPSYICATDVAGGKLIRVLPEWRSTLAPVHLVYPAQKFVPLTTKAFVEMAAPILQERLAL